MAEPGLSERFFKGILKKHGITRKEILNNKWKYCGGDYDRHKNYFNLYFKNDNQSLPKHADECVCGQAIERNAYITNEKDIIVLGSCCIKKFTPTGLNRTCKTCGEKHLNRLVNKCNKCRGKDGCCYRCDNINNSEYKECYKCRNQPKPQTEEEKKLHNAYMMKYNNHFDSIQSITKKIDEQVNNYNKCSRCNKKISSKYIRCYECKFGNYIKPKRLIKKRTINKNLSINDINNNIIKMNTTSNIKNCSDCDKEIDNKFKRCYECNRKFKRKQFILNRRKLKKVIFKK